jgi:hypothetical protein
MGVYKYVIYGNNQLRFRSDIPSNPIEEFNETVQNIQPSQEEPCETENEQSLAIEDQLEIMEDDFTETYIEYSDPHGLELDSEKDKEVHVEISDESIDEPVIYFDEVKELEFENVEYLDDLSSHPPPDEPVYLKNDFENLEENNMMVPVICSSSVYQPEDAVNAGLCGNGRQLQFINVISL